MEEVLRTWASLASNLVGDCFDYAKPYIDASFSEIDPLVRFVAAQLFIDCHLSSESVLLLIAAQKEWDADLLLRSIMEGSIKFAYMLHGTADEARAKVVEYWETLPQFTLIRRSQRAKRFLDELPNTEDAEWQPLRDLVLQDAEVLLIRKGHTSREQSDLEKRWSFTGICKAFAESPDISLHSLVHLAHGYGMSSNLVHKDGDGVGMVWDRHRREPVRQTAVKVGHSSRIVSDVCTFAKLRLIFLLRACKKPTPDLAELDKRYARLFSEIEDAGQRFIRIEYGV